MQLNRNLKKCLFALLIAKFRYIIGLFSKSMRQSTCVFVSL